MATLLLACTQILPPRRNPCDLSRDESREVGHVALEQLLHGIVDDRAVGVEHLARGGDLQSFLREELRAEGSQEGEPRGLRHRRAARAPA